MKIVVQKISSSARDTVLGIVAAELGSEVGYGHFADGAPMLIGSDLRISVSHSRRRAAVALGTPDEPPFGIDVEETDRNRQLLRVATRFLTEQEAALWADRLTEAWTCKEAVYKAARAPGLPLKAICLTEPGTATLPDGRRFALNSDSQPEYVITTAQELPL
ncbi:MAG: 4'-phosphopantetheinyl transferase superfamily protein [Muribaculaceae bacterium]|nr:4'-phosphopantetheinyl transferase superfamily protein [Muribaculaceae bacterium]